MTRRVLPTWFAPTLAGALFFVLLLFAYVAATISGGIMFWSYLDANVWSVGRPRIIQYMPPTLPDGITIDSSARAELTIFWLPLIAVLLIAYLIAMPLGRLVSGGWGRLADSPSKRGWRRPSVVLLIVCGVTLAAAFLAAIICSKLYWGYFLWPPSLDARVRDATKLISLTPFGSSRTESGQYTLVFEPRSEIDDETIARARTYSGELGGFRAVASSVRRGLIPPIPPVMPADQLAPLHEMLDRANLLESADPDFISGMPAHYVSRAKHLHGYVIEFVDPRGDRFMFISANGGEVANDHYPYYEFLFRIDSITGTPVLAASQRIYRDNAGIEGFEWPAMFAIFAALGLGVVMPVTFLVMLIRRLIERSRLGGRGFPVQVISRS